MSTKPKCGPECDWVCQQPDGFGGCGKRRAAPAQPEALRLAEYLRAGHTTQYNSNKAAAELERLHAENEALRAAPAQPEPQPEDWKVLADVAGILNAHGLTVLGQRLLKMSEVLHSSHEK